MNQERPKSPLKQLRSLVGTHAVKVSRRGMPYPVVIRGRIVGFVEVQRDPTRQRQGKRSFHRMCDAYNIPYEIWSPGQEPPSFIHEAAERLGERMS